MAQNSERERKARLIEVIFGPCTREEADDYAVRVSEMLNNDHSGFGPAVGLRYEVPSHIPFPSEVPDALPRAV